MERNVYIRDENIRRAFRYFDQEDAGRITVHNLIALMGR